MKQQVSLREANQHFSRYIEAVERGEEIIITRRGRPVAKIVKVRRLREPTAALVACLEPHQVKRASAAYREAGSGRAA